MTDRFVNTTGFVRVLAWANGGGYTLRCVVLCACSRSKGEESTVLARDYLNEPINSTREKWAGDYMYESTNRG